MRLDAEDAVTVHLEGSGRSNGLVFDRDGILYACLGGDRTVARFGRDGAATVLADSFGGKRLNSPNDLALDDAGGIYFTDPRYGGADDLEQDVMGVYYIAKSGGAVARVIDSQRRPNGVVVANDGKTLVVAEPDEREIRAYPIEAPGELGPGRVLFRSEEHLDGRGPDGMTFDAEGRLYATYRNVLVMTLEGELLRRIPVPENPTNCTFGGAGGATLFVTARTGLYRVETATRGAPLRTMRPEQGR
jgi:gluconolactonase